MSIYRVTAQSMFAPQVAPPVGQRSGTLWGARTPVSSAAMQAVHGGGAEFVAAKPARLPSAALQRKPNAALHVPRTSGHAELASVSRLQGAFAPLRSASLRAAGSPDAVRIDPRLKIGSSPAPVVVVRSHTISPSAEAPTRRGGSFGLDDVVSGAGRLYNGVVDAVTHPVETFNRAGNAINEHVVEPVQDAYEQYVAPVVDNVVEVAAPYIPDLPSPGRVYDSGRDYYQQNVSQHVPDGIERAVGITPQKPRVVNTTLTVGGAAHGVNYNSARGSTEVRLPDGQTVTLNGRANGQQIAAAIAERVAPQPGKGAKLTAGSNQLERNGNWVLNLATGENFKVEAGTSNQRVIEMARERSGETAPVASAPLTFTGGSEAKQQLQVRTVPHGVQVILPNGAGSRVYPAGTTHQQIIRDARADVGLSAQVSSAAPEAAVAAPRRQSATPLEARAQVNGAQQQLNAFEARYQQQADGKSGPQRLMDPIRSNYNQGYADDQLKNIGTTQQALANVRRQLDQGSISAAQADARLSEIETRFNSEAARVGEAQLGNARIGTAVLGAGHGAATVLGGLGGAAGGFFLGGPPGALAGAAGGSALAGSIYDAAVVPYRGSGPIAPQFNANQSLGGVASSVINGEKITAGNLVRGTTGTLIDAASGGLLSQGLTTARVAQTALGPQASRLALAGAAGGAYAKNAGVTTVATAAISNAGTALTPDLTAEQKRQEIRDTTTNAVLNAPGQLAGGFLGGGLGVGVRLPNRLADAGVQVAIDGATGLGQASLTNTLSGRGSRVTPEDIAASVVMAGPGALVNVSPRLGRTAGSPASAVLDGGMTASKHTTSNARGSSTDTPQAAPTDSMVGRLHSQISSRALSAREAAVNYVQGRPQVIRNQIVTLADNARGVRDSISQTASQVQQEARAFNALPGDIKAAVLQQLPGDVTQAAGHMAGRSLNQLTKTALAFPRQHPVFTATLMAGAINRVTDVRIPLPDIQPPPQVAGPNFRGMDVQPVRAVVDGQLRTVGYEGTGPIELGPNNELVSERGKRYELREPDGRAITDPDRAVARANELIRWGAATNLTYPQALRLSDQTQQRNDQLGELAARVPDDLTWTKTGIDRRSAPGEPNVYLGERPPPRTFERSEWQHQRSGASADPSLTANGMLVPNVVIELGEKRGAASLAPAHISVTKQPLDLFVPVTGSFDDFSTSSSVNSVYSSTRHPAGFYPGAADQRWGEAYHADPQNVPELHTSDYLGYRNFEPRQFWQAYFNAPNGLNPLTGASLNYRAVANRQEHGVFAFNSEDMTAGTRRTNLALAPYTWHQLGQVKVGVGNTPGGGVFNNEPRVPYQQTGSQHEFGVYLFNRGQSLTPPKPPADWHIVNGEITTDAAAWQQQFESLRGTGGLELRTESVLPQMGDRTAGVYVKVPGTPGRGSAVSSQELATQLQALGLSNPQFPELQYVTPEVIDRLNAAHVSDAILGVPTIPPGTWVNTGLITVEGEKGLFVPAEQLPAVQRSVAP
jgi:hypothetical protein